MADTTARDRGRDRPFGSGRDPDERHARVERASIGDQERSDRFRECVRSGRQRAGMVRPGGNLTGFAFAPFAD
jgi:hypothetical protein